jgi:death-on-curing protein
VAKRRHAPTWLSRVVIDAIHTDQLREHGGLPGIRDETVLESALARPRQKWSYADQVEVPMLAAAHAFGLVRNHPYRDGNKRVGFLAMVTLLGLNGYDFSASEAEVVTQIVALADGTVSEEALAEWVRQHSVKEPTDRSRRRRDRG